MMQLEDILLWNMKTSLGSEVVSSAGLQIAALHFVHPPGSRLILGVGLGILTTTLGMYNNKKEYIWRERLVISSHSSLPIWLCLSLWPTSRFLEVCLRDFLFLIVLEILLNVLIRVYCNNHKLNSIIIKISSTRINLT